MLVRRRTFSPLDVYSQTAFDRAFQQLTSSFFSTSSPVRMPVVNATRSGDSVILTVDLPGVPADAVDVEVSGRTLTLRAEHTDLSWERSVRLGSELDPESIDANYVDGRLTVTIGSAAAPAARKITVGTTPKALEQPSEEPVEATATEQTAESSEPSES